MERNDIPSISFRKWLDNVMDAYKDGLRDPANIKEYHGVVTDDDTKENSDDTVMLTVEVFDRNPSKVISSSVIKIKKE